MREPAQIGNPMIDRLGETLYNKNKKRACLQKNRGSVLEKKGGV